MTRMTMRGEKSMPVRQVGNRRRMGARTGSVARYRNWTMGFQGSGFTQEMRARAMTIHMYAQSAMFKTVATVFRRLPTTNIPCPLLVGGLDGKGSAPS